MVNRRQFLGITLAAGATQATGTQHAAGRAVPRHTRTFALVRSGLASLCAALTLGCGDLHPTAPQPRLQVSDIDLLRIFVRNSTNDNEREYVQVIYERIDGRSTMVMFRPAQPASEGLPAMPRVLLDSIGPQEEPPAEIVQIVNTFHVWAMTDSNAAGAACSTRTGQWVCDITFRDYSLVMGVGSLGTLRSQRYTRLGTTGNKTARALGDFVFEWSRRRAASAPPGASYEVDARRVAATHLLERTGSPQGSRRFVR